MKIYKNKILILCLFSVALFSCEKDGDTPTARLQQAPTELTASELQLVLIADNADNDAVTFAWTGSPVTWSDTAYSIKDPVEYSMEIDMEENGFTTPQVVNISNNVEKVFKVGELNDLLTRLQLEPYVAANVSVRVGAALGLNKEPVYSDAVVLNVTPYVIDTTYLYLPGSYQGWDPGTAPTVAADDNVKYEGYVYFADAAEFKFTSAPDWDHNNFGTGGGNALSKDPGAANLKIEGAGYYKLNADVDELTWSATPTVWGIIGSATPDGWSSDQDMTFNVDEGVWKITIELIDGMIKFRANDAWGIDFGDNDADGSLDYGGTDISVAAGTYEVILDLGDAPSYKYSLNRQ